MSIQDFIAQAAGQLGEGERSVQNATGGILHMIKEKAGDADFAKIAEKIPGADALASASAEADGGGGGGLLGGLAGMASGALGGGGDLISKLAGSGLDVSKIGSLAGSLVGFLKEKVGGDVMSGILSKVPDLKSILG